MKLNYSSILSKNLIPKRKIASTLALSIFSLGQLFSQTTYTFTSAGLTGTAGPTQTLITSAYASTNLNGLVTVSGGIQNFTVPSTGVYRIRAVGAQGGYNGGYGADIAGDFTLTAGTVLKILVGQRGTQGTNSSNFTAGGGGGGSFISNSSNVPYIVAGGGGGNADGYTGIPVVCCLNGMQASTLTSGNPFPGGSNGGSSGNGGTCSGTNGGGGAGFNGNGSLCGASTSALSFVNGGTGGIGTYNAGTAGHGGFGGGGGQYDTGVGMRGGGGGGYSGGGGGTASSGNDAAGGGGGSYNNGVSQTNTLNTAGGNGSVMITFNGVSSGPISGSNSSTVTFSYTGAMESYTVPTCVNTITFSVRGAKGGAGYPSVSSGGNGGQVTGVMTVTPGQVIQVYVGGTGGNGSASAGGAAGFNGGSLGALYAGSYSGGGGGGASDIRVSPYGLSDRIVVAGGGGGGAYNSSTTNYDRGGHGGGTSGEGGYSNGVVLSGGAPGAGGSSSSGGAGGFWSGYCTAASGSFGSGGPGGTCTNSGGGGGGGYYGGGGGVWAGGGGGSSYANPSFSNIVHSQGANSTSSASISFTLGISGTSINSITATPSVICPGNSAVLSTSGMTSYTWSSISGTISNNSTVTVSPVSSSNYTVMASNSSGCISGYSISLPVSSLPTISVNSGTICSGKTFTMIPSGAVTYSYAGGSSTVAPLSNNIYTVTGANAAGCVAAIAAVSSVTVVSLPVVSVNSGTVCYGNGFTLIPSGASSYTYSGGSSLVYPLLNTNYSVTGTGTNGCVSLPAIANVSVSPLPTVSVNSGTMCTGKVFTLSPTGASIYTLVNTGASGTSFTVSPASSTNYLVSGTSSVGCQSAGSSLSSVTVNTTPTVSATSGSICSGNSFSIVASGASTYTYSGGSANVSPLITTTYNVAGTSAQGCVSSNTAVSTVSVYITPTVAVTSGQICSNQVFTMTPSGASTYTFSNGSNTVSPLINTNYSVTGTSAQGCVSSNTAVATITVNARPTVSVNSGSLCSGYAFTMNPTGAFAYVYSSGSAVVSPASNTLYMVSGISAQGCASSNTAICTITVVASPTVAVSSSVICSGTSITFSPTGATTYTYLNGGPVVTPTTSTAYSVVGSNANGCISFPAISNVTVNITPTVSLNSGTICSGQSFTLLPTGASTYSFINGSAVVSPTSNASYSVTGISAQGCPGSNTAVSNVVVNVTPTITVNSGTICSGQSFTIVPSGAPSYSYSGGSNIVSPLSSIGYSVTGTSTAGCVSSVVISNVTVNITPTLSVNNGTICTGQSFVITPAGATSYTITGGSATVSPLTTSSYSVTGTSAQGCAGINTVVSTVVVNITPTVTVNSGSICAGQVFTLSPGGASTYTFSSVSNTVSPSTSTNYSVSGTSTSGCISANIAISSITVNPIPVIVVSGGSVCIGDSYTINPSGAATYSYSSGNAVVSPTVNSSYSLTGTSLAGCTSSLTVLSVTVNSLPIVSTQSSRNPICEGESAVLTASGAISYSWSQGSATNPATVNPSSATVYTVTGTDANGCKANAVITQSVDLCLGIQSDAKASVKVSVFPNPNNGSFMISCEEDIELSILNNIGQLVGKFKVDSNTGKLEINHLAQGMYYLVGSKNGSVINEKIIVTK